MKVHSHVFTIETKKHMDFVDITDAVEKAIRKNHITNGLVTIFSKHTTAAVRINERESGFFDDFAEFAKKVLPCNGYYRHNDLTIRTENLVCSQGATDCLNGHSHCLHLLMGTSESVPVIDGKLALGMWQRIFLIELDAPRKRDVVCQIIGE